MISVRRAISSGTCTPLASVTRSDGSPDGVSGVGGFLPGALSGALLAIQHIGARDLVVLAAHQGQFDLVLHVLDMKGAALAHPARQRADDFRGQLLDDFMHAAGGSRAVPLDREKRLGHRDRNLAGVEFRNRAVAADHLHRRLRARRGQRFGTQVDEWNGAGFAIERE